MPIAIEYAHKQDVITNPVLSEEFMFKHRHAPLRGCGECDRLYELGKAYQRGLQQIPSPVINPVDYLQDQVKHLQAELGKARLKIDVYEKMFNALRISVLPKEQ